MTAAAVGELGTIESYLQRSLAGARGRLGEAAAYAVLAPGKRVRPLLCVRACAAAGGHWHDAVPFACALELVHAMSLVHDDLPAMDAATTRRGRPCCHVAYGDAIAILVGDALLAHAFGVVAREAAPRDPALAGELVALLADAAAFDGLAGGQALELELSGTVPPAEARAAIVAGKTAALFEAATRGGGRIAGAPAAVVEQLARFGAALGEAFQAVDDCLDVRPEGDKTCGRDAAHGRPTTAASDGLAAGISAALRALAVARDALVELPDAAPLAELLDALGARLDGATR